MIAVDTCSFVAFLGGESGRDVDKIVDAIKNKQLFLPSVVVSEILSDPKLPKQIAKEITNFPMLDIKEGFWHRVGITRANIISKKLKARLADCLIAQQCIDDNITLITRDSDFRHFQKHAGLMLI